MSLEEINAEIIECARYGEPDELKELLQLGGNPNYQDESGNTAMHKAAANGEVECLKILKEFGANLLLNKELNSPLHWAAQNRQPSIVKFILDNYTEIDVLTQNGFGRSVLTEAFQSQCTEVIELILSHPSSSEEKLMSNVSDTNAKVTIDEDDSENIDKTQIKLITYEDLEKHSVTHTMSFDTNTSSLEGKPLKILNLFIRELPISRADNPFGSTDSPEDDTTGLGMWPAAIVASRWVIHNRELLKDKVVVEIGAGCGLPGLVAAKYCSPSEVFITDIHTNTLKNATYNVYRNSNVRGKHQYDRSETPVEGTYIIQSNSVYELNTEVPVHVKKVSWNDSNTYPYSEKGLQNSQSKQVDVIIGSDLVYENRILSILVPTLISMLKIGGHFLYSAPIEGRQGMDSLQEELTKSGIFECAVCVEANKSYFTNPLMAKSIIGNKAKEEEEEEEEEEEVNIDHNKSPSNDDGFDTEAEVTDDFILHFYDLSIKKPHYLYHFIKVK